MNYKRQNEHRHIADSMEPVWDYTIAYNTGMIKCPICDKYTYHQIGTLRASECDSCGFNTLTCIKECK